MTPMAHRTGRRSVGPQPSSQCTQNNAPKALKTQTPTPPHRMCAPLLHIATPRSPSTTPLARAGPAVMRSQLPPRAGRPRCGPSWGGGAGCHPGTRAPAGPTAAACPVQRALRRRGSPTAQACRRAPVRRMCAARSSDVGWSVAKAAEAPRQASRGAPTGAAEPGSQPSPPTHTHPTHPPTHPCTHHRKDRRPGLAAEAALQLVALAGPPPHELLAGGQVGRQRARLGVRPLRRRERGGGALGGAGGGRGA